MSSRNTNTLYDDTIYFNYLFSVPGVEYAGFRHIAEQVFFLREDSFASGINREADCREDVTGIRDIRRKSHHV